VLARCAGEHGMVGGQCIDLATENRTVSLDEPTFRNASLLSAVSNAFVKRPSPASNA